MSDLEQKLRKLEEDAEEALIQAEREGLKAVSQALRGIAAGAGTARREARVARTKPKPKPLTPEERRELRSRGLRRVDIGGDF